MSGSDQPAGEEIRLMARYEQGRFLGEQDVPDRGGLAGRTVAVLGYGNLGRSMALNLRDAGVEVVVGNIADAYRTVAEEDGFAVLDLAEASAAADLVYLLLPDEVIPAVFTSSVGPNLRSGSGLCLASGYALAFGLVRPPEGIDVLLLAPRMLGSQVRQTVLEGHGFLSYLSVEQDASGQAWSRLLALALAAGSLRRGAMVLSARQEATLDLFIEQSVGPYLGMALQMAFAVGTEAGLPAEALVLEMYMSGEMSRTIQGFAEEGFYQAVKGHGLVATYGGFLGTLDLDGAAMHRQFVQVLARIASGEFARRLQQEEADGYPTNAAIEKITAGDDALSAAERRVRAALNGPAGGAAPPGR
jgi:ketol-acid reductoisomerase